MLNKQELKQCVQRELELELRRALAPRLVPSQFHRMFLAWRRPPHLKVQVLWISGRHVSISVIVFLPLLVGTGWEEGAEAKTPPVLNYWRCWDRSQQWWASSRSSHDNVLQANADFLYSLLPDLTRFISKASSNPIVHGSFGGVRKCTYITANCHLEASLLCDIRLSIDLNLW